MSLKAKYLGTIQTVHDCPSKGRTAQAYRGEIVFENGDTENVSGFNCSMLWHAKAWVVDTTEAEILPDRQY